jgi:hypothetical protein
MHVYNEMSGERHTRVFELDPALLRHAAPAQRAVAARRALVPSTVLASGRRPFPVHAAEPWDLGFLVLGGVLLQRVDIAGRRAAEVLGRGDVVRPPVGRRAAAIVSWEVLEPARIALLDRRFEEETHHLRGVMSQLIDRSAARSARLSAHLVIAGYPRMEDRLVAVFRLLAGRFGRPRRGGIAIGLSLTQATLAELVAGRRQAVNVALGRLEERRIIIREGGGWLLRGTAAPDPPAAGAG